MSYRKPIDVRGAGGGGGGKGGGGASHVAVEDPNTLQSNSIAYAVYLLSMGPIYGLSDGDKSIFFDKTALRASSGSFNFSGVSWELRTGEADQETIPGFVSVANTISVDVDVKMAAAVVRTIPGPVDAARVTVVLPYLAYQNPSTGDLVKTSVSYKVSRRPYGGGAWEDIFTRNIYGKCVSPYQETTRIELGGTTDWDVKVERLTADSTASNLRNETRWASYTALTDGKFAYPNSAVIGLKASAKQFGNTVPVLLVKAKGRLVRIPTNYDAEARTYTGVWDGTFKTGYTNNPAWVLLDLLLDAENGCGLTEDQVDVYSLYAIAQYADEMVDDGYGGKEPRYTFNFYMKSAGPAEEVLQNIAASFRGLTFESGGKRYFFADMPQDSVRLYTNADVVGGRFSYEGLALSARHSVAMVTWYDKDDYCSPAIEVVEDADLIARFGWREIALTALGCTSRGQAHRAGKWILDTEKNATRTVNFEVGLQGHFISPGDVVDIFDQRFAALRLGGRLLEYTANSVTLDEAVTLVAGQTYTLKVSLADGSVGLFTVTSPPGERTVLSFSPEFMTEPVIGATVGLSSAAVRPQQYRILSVKGTDKGTFLVSGLAYDPTKYARVEQDIVLEPLSYTRFSRDAPSAPVGIEVVEYAYRYSHGLRSAAALTVTPFDPTEPVRGYEIEYQQNESAWRSLGVLPGPTGEIRDCDAGAYVFRARAIGMFGNTSGWFEVEKDLFGLAAPPSAVTDLGINVIGDIATLFWSGVPDVDLSHYRIKFAADTEGTWETAVDVFPRVTDTAKQVPTIPGVYLVKAVDLSGTESTDAASVVVPVTSVTRNVVQTVDDAPTWAGTKTNFVVDSSKLKMTGSGEATYIFASTLDLSEVYVSRLVPSLKAHATRASDTWAVSELWSDPGKWAAAAPDTWTLKLQVRTTQDDPAGSPVWSDWQDLILGDYEARAFQFRLVATSSDDNNILYVEEAGLTVDMPDRIIGAKDISAANTGHEVTFSPAFKNLSSLEITLKNGASGDYFTYTAGPTTTGFTIRFYDKNDVAVARTFGYTATGYGRVIA